MCNEGGCAVQKKSETHVDVVVVVGVVDVVVVVGVVDVVVVVGVVEVLK